MVLWSLLQFKSKINESKEDCEVKFARERLAKLSRNLAVFKVWWNYTFILDAQQLIEKIFGWVFIHFFSLKVGGASKAGVDKNYKSVQNALEAAKAATEGGTVPGNF